MFDYPGGMEVNLDQLAVFANLSELWLAGGCLLKGHGSSRITFPDLKTLGLELKRTSLNLVHKRLHAPNLECFYFSFRLFEEEGYDNEGNAVENVWSTVALPALEIIEDFKSLQKLVLKSLRFLDHLETSVDEYCFTRIVDFVKAHKFLSLWEFCGGCALLDFYGGYYDKIEEKILGTRISTLQQLLQRNRLNYGCEMAKSRITGNQRVELSLWPLIFSLATRAFVSERDETNVSKEDGIFHLLRERACKEIF